MSNTKNINTILGIFFAACLTFLSQPAQAGIAGHVQFVNGNVQITNSTGKTRTLQKGDAVHESDTLTTAKEASAQIKMRDGGLIAVRPDSQLKFDSFVFNGEEDSNDKSFFSLLRGGFRAVTGLVGQKFKSNYRIITADSTIGIRGTDHETFVVVPGSQLAATVPAGTYNKVNSGETVMTTQKGTVNILPNQMGYAAAADQMPQLQPVNLKLFTAVPPPLQGSSTTSTGRGNTVVDGSIQEQNMAPGTAVPQNSTMKPITAPGVTSPQPIKF